MPKNQVNRTNSLYSAKYRWWSKTKYSFEWLGIFATIFALVFTLFQWRNATVFEFDGDAQVLVNDVMKTYEGMYRGLVWLLCITMSILLFFTFRNAKLLARANENFRELEQLSKLKHSTVMINNINDESKDIINYITASESFVLNKKKTKLIKKDHELIKESIQSVHQEFGQYTSDVINNTKNLFDIITHDEVSVTIKYFKHNKKNNFITAETGGRDSVSKNKRKQTDISLKVFAAESNTAFNEIIQFNKIYFSEDLNSEYDKGNYQNANPDWRKFYNACLVVGLNYRKPSSMSETMDTLGALCIDNFYGNFDNDVAQNFAQAITNSFAGAYKQYLVFLDRHDEKKEMII